MLSWQQTGLMAQLLWGILPEANRNLARWRDMAQSQLDPPLRQQALSSLSLKRFHAQGAASYALLTSSHSRDLVALTVALQTISDYLDNLCDRMGIIDELVFRRLHSALLFWEEQDQVDIYRGLTQAQDRGYLASLKERCRRLSQKLPQWTLVQPRVSELLHLYIDLQVYKHLQPEERILRLQQWHRAHAGPYPQLYWNEFAAACGSTLAVFALLAAAASPRLQPQEVQQIHDAYFPTICAMHILLDYLIDEEEDRAQDQLNFVSLYASRSLCRQRLRELLGQAAASTLQLENSHFHRLLVSGLVAVYLSDPKAHRHQEALTSELLAASGPDARSLHRLAQLLRQLGVLQRR